MAPADIVLLENIKGWLTPALYGFGTLAIVAETLWFIVTRRPRDVRARRLGIQCGGLAFGLGYVFYALVMLDAQTFVYAHRIFDLGLGPSAFLVCFLANDAMFYVSHRLAHEVRLLWCVHVVHHSSRHYDLTTGVRGSVFDAFFHFPFYVWIPLLGVHPLVWILVETGFKFYGLAYHTDLVGKLGPLEGVLVTPSSHRVHHGCNPAYLDRNYGGFFSLFDRALGTYTPETEPVRYGLTKDWNGTAVLDCQLHELRDLVRDVRAASGLDKLRLLYKPPGWTPPVRARPAPAAAWAE